MYNDVISFEMPYSLQRDVELNPQSVHCSQATFTLRRFRFNSFLLMKALPVYIPPFSNENTMTTIGVHIAPAKRCC